VTPLPQAPDPRGSGHRYVLLDGLRGVAAIAVVVHHIAVATRSRQLFDGAPLAVDFFFCLSGFVIAHAYHSRLLAGMSLREFARRRLVRLYPMYVIGQVLGLAGLLLLASRALTDLAGLELAKATLLNLLYLPYFNLATVQVMEARISATLFPSNNPAWSLFFELLVNAAYALVAAVDRRLVAAFVALSGVALCVAAAMYGRAPGWAAFNFAGGLPRVGYAFFFGVLIYLWRAPLQRLPKVSPAILVALVIALFAVPRLERPFLQAYWLAAALLAVPLLVILGSNSRLRSEAGERACDYLGRLSYPIYCLHFPILMLLQLALPRGLAVGWVLAAGLGASVAASHVLMAYVDEPFRLWLTSRLRGGRTGSLPS